LGVCACPIGHKVLGCNESGVQMISDEIAGIEEARLTPSRLWRRLTAAIALLGFEAYTLIRVRRLELGRSLDTLRPWAATVTPGVPRDVAGE
jgi:hypothetical protein